MNSPLINVVLHNVTKKNEDIHKVIMFATKLDGICSLVAKNCNIYEEVFLHELRYNKENIFLLYLVEVLRPLCFSPAQTHSGN